jgi:hypothetical protein
VHEHRQRLPPASSFRHTELIAFRWRRMISAVKFSVFFDNGSAAR